MDNIFCSEQFDHYWKKSCNRETLNLSMCAECSKDTDFFILLTMGKIVIFHVSPVTFHLSHVTCHLSPVTCHLTTTLCSFSCYESPRRLNVCLREVWCLIEFNKKILLHNSFLSVPIWVIEGKTFFWLEVFIPLK